MKKKKILVTTDFSQNSKTAIRYALALAATGNFRLTFFHTFQLRKKESETNNSYESRIRVEKIRLLQQLKTFIESLPQAEKLFPNFKYAVHAGFSDDSSIMEYAAKNNFDFISLCLRGRTSGEKLLGSTASNVISQSVTPVIAVPKDYEPGKVAEVVYLSDLENLKSELGQVVSLVKNLNSTASIVHFADKNDIKEKENYVAKVLRSFRFDFSRILVIQRNKNIALHNEINNFLVYNKPSLVIMFTKLNKTFLQKLFNLGNTTKVTTASGIPVVVFKK